MIRLGLTGSIGMGKSTTATMFREEGISVHDADRTVHELYAGRAAPLIEAAFPGTVTDNIVDRKRLGEVVIGNPEALKRLEAIIHPLVGEEEEAFLERARKKGARIVVLDIPLLFETGADARVDAILVVTAPPEVQRRRVLERGAMNEEQFEKILAKQMPDEQKRKRADFIIDTSLGMENARQAVKEILETLTRDNWQNRPNSG